MVATFDDVLDFWFGKPATSEAELAAQLERWFQGGPNMDRAVIERFGDTLEAALRGELDGWAATPRGRLALVIVLDQLSRNALRDEPRMYAGDPVAQRLACEAFDQGLDPTLSFLERLFLSMPLLHSEELAMHERLAKISARLASEAPPLYRGMVAMSAEQVAKYHDLIARFGRFPHRNAILGRATTPEERLFLEEWAAKAPPRGMRPAQS